MWQTDKQLGGDVLGGSGSNGITIRPGGTGVGNIVSGDDGGGDELMGPTSASFNPSINFPGLMLGCLRDDQDNKYCGAKEGGESLGGGREREREKGSKVQLGRWSRRQAASYSIGGSE